MLYLKTCYIHGKYKRHLLKPPERLGCSSKIM